MISNPTRGDELCVLFMLTLVSVSSFLFEANRKVEVRWFTPVLLAAFLSVLFNIRVPQATIYWNVFLAVLLCCLSVKTIGERFSLSQQSVGRVLIRMWLAIYLVLIAQKLGFVFKGYELSGFYTMPWIMGCAATLSIPFIRKLKSWYGSILILPIVMSHSSAIVAVALVMWFQPRLKLRSILWLIFLGLSYIFLFDKGLDVARFAVIKKSVPYIHNWITGDGIGSWAHRAFVRHNGADLYYWRWAHNELYQMTTETGILGSFCVLALISNLFKRISLDQKYTLFGICALTMVHPIFHIPRLIPFLILILAFMVRRNSVEC